MKQIEVIIQKDGITAIEVNPYKAELDKEESLGHSPSFNLLESFRSYELMPRTYKIETINGFVPTNIVEYNYLIRSQYTPRKAEILPNGNLNLL